MIRVKETKPHKKGYTTIDSESYRTVTVAEGKLILVNIYETKVFDTSFIFGTIAKTKLCLPTVNTHLSLLQEGFVAYKPIIISETEREILDGELFYDSELRFLLTMTTAKQAMKDQFKVLALPEHFSPQQLQDIVDGKMKDQDKILVECEQKFSNITVMGENGEDVYVSRGYFINLNSQGHVTLYKAEIMSSELEIRGLRAELALAKADIQKLTNFQVYEKSEEKVYTEEQVRVLFNKLSEDSGIDLDPVGRFEEWFRENVK